MSMLLEKKIIVKNKQGLHARPAALFVQLANKFESKVTVVKEGQSVNGKSIMGILILAAEQNSEIQLIVEGSDAQQALNALEDLVTKEESSVEK